MLGYVAGIVFFTGTFHWLGALGKLFGQPWLYGLPLLLAVYLALYFAFWAWFVGLLGPVILSEGQRSRRTPSQDEQRRQRAGSFDFVLPRSTSDRMTAEKGAASSTRNLAIAALAACAWVTHEWVRGWLFTGFGWNGLGVALHEDLAMIQVADLTGVAGLSFLVAFCNVMIVLVVRRIIDELGPVFLKRVRWEFTLTVALIAIVFSYGVRTLMRANREPGIEVRVGMIQPNTPQFEKWDANSEGRIFERLDLLTRAVALSKPDLLVWPETATPRGMFADETNYRFMLESVDAAGAPLLFGTVDFDPERQEAFNCAALLANGGKDVQFYRKIHLVPFGEFMPFRRSFPLFAAIAGDLVPGDFGAGNEFTVMTLPQPRVRLSTLICFEDTVANLTRRFVQNGAQLLVNVTNDGWFLKTAAAEQHLANAVFRAIENRRPLLRCANTGVTCAIDRDGRVDRWSEPFREEAQAARPITVPTAATTTFYTRHGDWLAVTACFVAGFAMLGLIWRERLRAAAQNRQSLSK